MNSSSKSSKKIAKPKSKKTIAGSPNLSISRMPNEGIIKVVKKRTDYSSMWKAIQKIANPVSFEQLKRFYKI